MLSQEKIKLIEDRVASLEKEWNDEYRDVVWLKKYFLYKGLKALLLDFIGGMYSVITLEEKEYAKKWRHLIELHIYSVEQLKSGKLNIENLIVEIEEFKKILQKFYDKESNKEESWKRKLDTPVTSWTDKSWVIARAIEEKRSDISHKQILTELYDMFDHRRILINRIIKECDGIIRLLKS